MNLPGRAGTQVTYFRMLRRKSTCSMREIGNEGGESAEQHFHQKHRKQGEQERVFCSAVHLQKFPTHLPQHKLPCHKIQQMSMKFV